MSSTPTELSFGQDVEFLNKHLETLVLSDPESGARLALAPGLQARVMTSSATGDDGVSFGWINYERIRSGQPTPHMNAFGGEERFWLGPEGGQFSIFFEPGAEFDFENWQTPPLIDLDGYPVVEKSGSMAAFRKPAVLRNYSGTEFQFTIDRKIELLSKSAAKESLNADLNGLDLVAYRSTNQLTNTGDAAWLRDSGLLSIWLLGMYKPGPLTTIVAPIRSGDVDQLGPAVNDAYFGAPPADRIRIEEDAVFFKGDGLHRGKIGVSPARSKGICGGYDGKRQALTLVKYRQPTDDDAPYVNSMWEIQEDPYSGDAINSYNDGPPEPGAEPMGPFCELETSSPALELARDGVGSHQQVTFHLVGEPTVLDRVARASLGVSLERIQQALT